MMRIKERLCNLVFVVVLAACSARSAAAPITNVPKTPTSPAVPPSPSNMMTPTISMTATSPPTILAVTQPAMEDIEWAMYVFDVGVSFEYPHDWIIMRENERFVEFFAISYLPYNVWVDVEHRPVEDKTIADPHSAVPNEGGYEVLWEKPIAIESAQGLEYIWGIPAENQIGGRLIAIYYSKQHELEVRLSTDADDIPSESNRFAVFEYMVQSVQIGP